MMLAWVHGWKQSDMLSTGSLAWLNRKHSNCAPQRRLTSGFGTTALLVPKGFEMRSSVSACNRPWLLMWLLVIDVSTNGVWTMMASSQHRSLQNRFLERFLAICARNDSTMLRPSKAIAGAGMVPSLQSDALSSIQYAEDADNAFGQRNASSSIFVTAEDTGMDVMKESANISNRWTNRRTLTYQLTFRGFTDCPNVMPQDPCLSPSSRCGSNDNNNDLLNFVSMGKNKAMQLRSKTTYCSTFTSSWRPPHLNGVTPWIVTLWAPPQRSPLAS